jgi:hypothetical protein
MEKREIPLRREKREIDPYIEKIIMDKFPVTTKEKSGCATERMKNMANRDNFKKRLKEFIETFTPKYE